MINNSQDNILLVDVLLEVYIPETLLLAELYIIVPADNWKNIFKIFQLV